MFKYVLQPREGYGVASIIVDGANLENSVIAVLDKRTGIKVAEIPATDFALSLFNPEMPKAEFEMMSSDGRTVSLGISWKEDVLYGGSNPFDQIIVKIVREHKKITEDEVITKIVKDYSLCKDTKKNREWLRRRILRLRNLGVLNLKYGRLELGLVKLPLNKDIRVPFEVGYNPIMKRMYDFVEAYGSVEIRKLELHLLYELGWCTKEEFDHYLDLMVEKGWLRKVNEFEVTVERPIEPNR